MRLRVAVAATATAFVLFDIFALAALLYSTGAHHSDFFAFWTYSRIAATHPAAVLYDPEPLHVLQLGLHLTPGAYLPYLYPPSYLLVLWPLHWLSEPVARVVWTGAGLLLYLAALSGGPFGRFGALAALILPATMFGIVSGQNGFLTGALMLGGLRLLPHAAWRAGILLGMLSVKPQLCPLLPVALIAGRQWRALGGAALSASAGMVLSSILFGGSIWWVWLRQMPVASAYLARHYVLAEKLHAWPTVVVNLRGAGLPPAFALIAQTIVALAVAAALWRAWRPGVAADRARPVALLLVGTFLVTPYAAYYDETLAAAAVLLVLRETRPPSFVAMAVLAAALWLPLLIWLPPVPLLAPAILGLLFMVILAWDRPHPAMAACPTVS